MIIMELIWMNKEEPSMLNLRKATLVIAEFIEPDQSELHPAELTSYDEHPFDAVSVQNVGSTYIIVSWDLPTHSNGILINFSLYCNGALAGVLPPYCDQLQHHRPPPLHFVHVHVLQSPPTGTALQFGTWCCVISAAASLPSGFSVHTGDQHRIFKPMSVQSMWTTLQMLYKSTEVARACNHYVGGLSHSCLGHYKGLMVEDWNILNECDDKQTFEAQLVNRLREIMLGVDLEEVSSKQLRLKLEEEMKMDLKAYREFLDQQMLVILGQLEKPSKICDYLYLDWFVNVTREIDNFYPEVFTYFNVRLYDLPDSELMKHWDKTYQFIKTAKHNELWGKHAPNRLFPHQRTMSEPNIRNMSPNMEMDYPLSPHHEEQSSFTHQFMSTNDLQQEGHLNSNWSPTRTNLMNSGQVNKTEGVLQFLSSLPPLSDDDEVYREHSECSKPGHSSSPFLTPPQSRRSERRKESTLSNSTGGLCCSHNESRGTHTVPAIDVRAGKGLALVGAAPNGGASTVDEHVESGSVIVATVPDVCNPAADPHVVIGTDKSVGTEEEKKKGKEVMREEEKKKEFVKEEPKKDERVISEEDQKEKFTDKKEEENRDKDGDSEVNSVLALRKLFGDPEPKKPEPQQWQQLQLFAKVSPKSQEPARSTSPCPSLSTSATPSVKKELPAT
eukprot:Em0126g7a